MVNMNPVAGFGNFLRGLVGGVQQAAQPIGQAISGIFQPQAFHVQTPPVAQAAGPSFDQKMATQGYTKQPNGIYYQGPGPTSTPIPTRAPQVLGAQTTQPSNFGNRLISAASVQSGINRFGPNTPIATMSGQLAQAGGAMPQNVDPYLPAVVSLMETGGGAKQVGLNNPLNITGIGSPGQTTPFVNYPNPQTAILGGPNGDTQSGGFVGMINHTNPSQPDYYADFRRTGDLKDFFSHYTPPGEQYGNPSMDQLIARYKALRGLF